MYGSDAPAHEINRQLRDAIKRLLSAAHRVQTLANMRAEGRGSRHGAPPTAPRTRELVEEHVEKEYRRLLDKERDA
jgi:hypothetical protein